jgi:hypothetical protein
MASRISDRALLRAGGLTLPNFNPSGPEKLAERISPRGLKIGHGVPIYEGGLPSCPGVDVRREHLRTPQKKVPARQKNLRLGVEKGQRMPIYSKEAMMPPTFHKEPPR